MAAGRVLAARAFMNSECRPSCNLKPRPTRLQKPGRVYTCAWCIYCHIWILVFSVNEQLSFCRSRTIQPLLYTHHITVTSSLQWKLHGSSCWCCKPRSSLLSSIRKRIARCSHSTRTESGHKFLLEFMVNLEHLVSLGERYMWLEPYQVIS